MDNTIVSIDVHDVVMDFVGSLLKEYNDATGETVTPEEIRSWDISSYVKQPMIIDVLMNDPKVYLKSPQVRNAQECIRMISEVYKVVFVSAAKINTVPANYRWLFANGFLTSEDQYVVIKDKSLIRAHVLIDDNVENLREFSRFGVGYLFRRPWNMDCKWPEPAVMDGWDPDWIRRAL